MSLLKSSWKNTTPVCADCGEKFELTQFRKGFVYKCPKCGCQFDTLLFEKILDKIAQMDAERFEANELYSIQGEKFTISNKIKCEIAEEGELFNTWTVSIKVIR